MGIKVFLGIILISFSFQAYADDDGVLVSKERPAPAVSNNPISNSVPSPDIDTSTVMKTTAPKSIEQFVDEVVRETYPRSVQEVVFKMLEQQPQLQLPPFFVEEWIQKTAMTVLDNPTVKQALRDANDQGVDVANEQRKTHSSDIIIVQRVYDTIHQALTTTELKQLYFDTAQRLLQPFMAQQDQVLKQQAVQQQYAQSMVQVQQQQQVMQQGVEEMQKKLQLMYQHAGQAN